MDFLKDLPFPLVLKCKWLQSLAVAGELLIYLPQLKN